MRILISASGLVPLAIRCGLAAVMTVAAISKANDPTSAALAFEFLVGGRVSALHAMPLMAALGGAEFAIALSILCWHRAKAPLAVLACMLTVFLLVQLYFSFAPDAPACGCFGGATAGVSGKAAALGGVLINGGLLLLVAAAWPGGHRDGPPLRKEECGNASLHTY